MLSEFFPFSSKYLHYIFIGILTYFIIKIIFKRNYLYGNDIDCNRDVEKSAKSCCYYDDDDNEPALPKDLQHIPYVYTKPNVETLMSNAREFYRLSNCRRTIRYFKPDPIPKSVLHDIIRAAGTAPSGAHTEPWTFVAVSDMKLKAQIRSIIEQEEEINYKKRMGNEWITDLLPLRTNWVKEYLTVAPHLILVFKRTYGTLANGKKKTHYYHEMSVLIACGILITAIQYAGLVTLTSTPLNCGSALRSLLRRPTSEKLCLLLPVGYPADNATVPDLQRKPLSEILIEFN